MTPAEREERILSLRELVRNVAKKRMRTLPQKARVEDLISAGWLGAIYAVDRFDSTRGGNLFTYAEWRIRGAIQDYLRSIDHLTRDHRQLVTRGAEEAPITISLDAPFHTGGHEMLPDLSDAIGDERAKREQARQDARIALEAIYRRARMKPRWAKVLRLYMEGETMKAIGRSEGVNESRISQICSNAIRKLRAAA